MASGAVPLLRCVTLLVFAVLSSLQLVIPAASQLSKPRPLDASSTAWLPAAGAAGEQQQQQSAKEDSAAVAAARTCTYTVKVKTSCASPRRSSDGVSLAFGDAYRNEVYVAQLAPRGGFERCATDTFRVAGPCGYGVCYLYLRRASGARDGGWTPEWVRVYEPTSSTPSTFYYGDAFPAGVWYGFNRCPRLTKADGDGDASSSDAAAQSM